MRCKPGSPIGRASGARGHSWGGDRCVRKEDPARTGGQVLRVPVVHVESDHRPPGSGHSFWDTHRGRGAAPTVSEKPIPQHAAGTSPLYLPPSAAAFEPKISVF